MQMVGTNVALFGPLQARDDYAELQQHWLPTAHVGASRAVVPGPLLLLLP